MAATMIYKWFTCQNIKDKMAYNWQLLRLEIFKWQFQYEEILNQSSRHFLYNIDV